MLDSVPSPGYSPVCNVLRQWKTSLNPTYRVYRLYDISLSYPDLVTTGFCTWTTIISNCMLTTCKNSSCQQGLVLRFMQMIFYSFIDQWQQYVATFKCIIESVDSISKDERGFPLT